MRFKWYLINMCCIDWRDSIDEKFEAGSGERFYSWGIGIHIFWVQIQYSFCCTSLEAPVKSGNNSKQY